MKKEKFLDKLTDIIEDTLLKMDQSEAFTIEDLYEDEDRVAIKLTNDYSGASFVKDVEALYTRKKEEDIKIKELYKVSGLKDEIKTFVEEHELDKQHYFEEHDPLDDDLVDDDLDDFDEDYDFDDDLDDEYDDFDEEEDESEEDTETREPGSGSFSPSGESSGEESAVQTGDAHRTAGDRVEDNTYLSLYPINKNSPDYSPDMDAFFEKEDICICLARIDKTTGKPAHIFSKGEVALSAPNIPLGPNKNGMEWKAVDLPGQHCFIITTESGLYGAAVLSDFHFLNEICEKIEKDSIVLLPTSIHETTVIYDLDPGSMTDADRADLQTILSEINALNTKDTKVSDSVFIYDSKTLSLTPLSEDKTLDDR